MIFKTKSDLSITKHNLDIIFTLLVSNKWEKANIESYYRIERFIIRNGF